MMRLSRLAAALRCCNSTSNGPSPSEDTRSGHRRAQRGAHPPSYAPARSRSLCRRPAAAVGGEGGHGGALCWQRRHRLGHVGRAQGARGVPRGHRAAHRVVHVPGWVPWPRSLSLCDTACLGNGMLCECTRFQPLISIGPAGRGQRRLAAPLLQPCHAPLWVLWALPLRLFTFRAGPACSAPR